MNYQKNPKPQQTNKTRISQVRLVICHLGLGSVSPGVAPLPCGCPRMGSRPVTPVPAGWGLAQPGHQAIGHLVQTHVVSIQGSLWKSQMNTRFSPSPLSFVLRGNQRAPRFGLFFLPHFSISLGAGQGQSVARLYF